MSENLTLLVANLAMDPKNAAAQLRNLHNLALYDSGHATIGASEKAALYFTMELANSLEKVDPVKLRALI